MSMDPMFFAGVIEGFYGPPWTPSERAELFGWMSSWGLNTYFYAPKDDLKHRAIWRELYSEIEAADLKTLITACSDRQIQFVYGLSPGLDVRYSSPSDRAHLKQRLEQLFRLGCHRFCLLFDDIPDRMDPADILRWPSLAAAQADLTNELFIWARSQHPHVQFLFCPTPYCGRMAMRKHGGDGYLETLGAHLLPDIHVFWTGPEIISREITVPHLQEVRSKLRRKPLLWDNLHANDYDGRRFFVGPYSGRAPEIRAEISGILANPNTEFHFNFPGLKTMAEFIHHQGSWDPREAYVRSMQAWLPLFDTARSSAHLEDLLLFGDCFYLPHTDGPLASQLLSQAQTLLRQSPTTWTEATEFRQAATRLRDFCARTAELKCRPLFYALNRRVWELREELDLLEGYIKFRSNPANTHLPCESDFHLPKTYRGSFTARLQTLLTPSPDGVFHPSTPDHPIAHE